MALEIEVERGEGERLVLLADGAHIHVVYVGEVHVEHTLVGCKQDFFPTLDGELSWILYLVVASPPDGALVDECVHGREEDGELVGLDECGNLHVHLLDCQMQELAVGEREWQLWRIVLDELAECEEEGDGVDESRLFS